MTANQLTAVRNTELARNNRELERLRALELDETKTHNRVSEAELKRHQLATENISRSELMERTRSNFANEAIGRTNASANVMNAYSNQRNAESNRLNAYTNQQNAVSNRLNATTNQANAYISGLNTQISAANLSELRRHNKAVEAETARYQTAMNEIAADKNTIERRNTEIHAYDAQTGRERLGIEKQRMYMDLGGTIMNDITKLATVQSK